MKILGELNLTGNSGNDLIVAYSGASQRLGVDSNGNTYISGTVGIGTTSPLGKLHVEYIGPGNQLRVVGNGGSLFTVDDGVVQTNGYYLASTTGNGYTFNGDGSVGLRRNGAGNVALISSIGATSTTSEKTILQGTNNGRVGLGYQPAVSWDGNSVEVPATVTVKGEPDSTASTTDMIFMVTKNDETETMKIKNDGSVGIGDITTLNAKLHIEGEGSTSATNALLVENSSGNDLLVIDDAGNTVFNANSIDSNFSIYGDTDTNLFRTNAGEDSVGIGIDGQATSKLYVDATNETRTYIAAFQSNTAQNGILLTHNGSNSAVFGAQFNSTTSNASGTARGVWANSTGGSSANNYGIYGRSGNGSSQNIGVYGINVFGNGSSLNVGVYGSDAAPAAVKHGVYGVTSTGSDGVTTTSYAVRGLNQTSADDVTNYGVHARVSLAASTTGSTNYGLYVQETTAIGAGNTNYGLVVESGSNNSGFGTATPSTLVEVDGGQFKVNQYTHTLGSVSATTMDFNNGNNQVIDFETSTGDMTITLSGGSAGGRYIIKTIQSSTPRTLTFDAGGDSVLWGGGTPPSATLTNDAIDLYEFYYDGGNYIGRQIVSDAQ
jgi:hypothetical protein